MANKSGGGISTVFLGGLAVLLALAFVGCDDIVPTGPTGSLSASDVQIENVSQMTQLVGQEVAAQGVRVDHVAADEGFWVDLVGGRIWVQLIGPGESPYTVRDGNIVSFRGRIVSHGPSFPAPLGMCSQQDYDDLSAQPTHIEVPFDALAFGVG